MKILDTLNECVDKVQEMSLYSIIIIVHIRYDKEIAKEITNNASTNSYILNRLSVRNR
jgi:hypothetical protein